MRARRTAPGGGVAGPLLAVALAAAAPVALEAALGYVRAGSDLGWFFLPLWTWWWRDPRPLAGWNPWLFAGYPAAADPQLAVWHPLTALYGVLPPLGAASVEGALVPAVAGAGMLLYLRRVGAGSAASLVGALSFALGGFVAAHAPHPSIGRAAMALPWGVLAIESLEGRRLAAALALVVGLVLLAGQPQVSALVLVLLGLYALVLGRPLMGRRVGWLACGFLLGVVIGGALWLPALELVAASTRAVRTPAFPNPTLALRDLPLLLVPFAGGGGLGPLGGGERSGLACGLIECSAYPGAVVWLVLLACLVPILRDRRGRFWLAVAVAGVAVASGALPLPTGVRGPARMLLWWSAGAAAAAGLGLGAALRRPWRRLAWGGALVVLVLAACVLALDLPPERRPAAWGTLLALAVAGLALLVASRGGRAAALPAALALDLVVFTLTLMAGGVPRAAFAELKAPLAPLREALATPGCALDPRERVLLLDPPFSIDWAAPLEVRSAQGYDPLVLRRTAELLGQLEHGLEAIGWVSDASLAAPGNRALDVLRVGLVVRDPRRPNPLGTAIAVLSRAGDERWQAAPGCAPPGLEAYRNTRVRPVAWLAGRSVAADAGRAIALVRGAAGAFDVEREVAVAGEAGPHDASDTPEEVRGTVQVHELPADLLRLEVEAADDAWLVTSELAYPGWTARLDDAPAELVVANGAFRALRVPPGRHRVELAFRPRAARLGALLGALGLGVALVLAVAGGGRAKEP